MDMDDGDRRKLRGALPGCSQIHVLDHHWSEERSGFNDETTTIRVVCLDSSGQYRSATYTETFQFGPRRSGSTIHLEWGDALSPTAFELAAAGRERIDVN